MNSNSQRPWPRSQRKLPIMRPSCAGIHISSMCCPLAVLPTQRPPATTGPAATPPARCPARRALGDHRRQRREDEDERRQRRDAWRLRGWPTTHVDAGTSWRGSAHGSRPSGSESLEPSLAVATGGSGDVLSGQEREQALDVLGRSDDRRTRRSRTPRPAAPSPRLPCRSTSRAPARMAGEMLPRGPSSATRGAP